MLVRPDYTGVQKQPLQVGVLEFAEHVFPDSLLGPTAEPTPHRVPVAEAFGQVSPRCPGLGDPENSIHEKPVVLGGNTWVSRLAGQKILDPFPLVVRNRVSVLHGGPSLAKALVQVRPVD